MAWLCVKLLRLSHSSKDQGNSLQYGCTWQGLSLQPYVKKFIQQSKLLCLGVPERKADGALPPSIPRGNIVVPQYGRQERAESWEHQLDCERCLTQFFPFIWGATIPIYRLLLQFSIAKCGRIVKIYQDQKM